MGYEAPTRSNLNTRAGTQAEKAVAEYKKIQAGIEANETRLGALYETTVRVAKVALTGGAANAIAAAWQNPESVPVIITRTVLDLTTAGGTATAVLDVGTAADATTGSDNLIDGVDANAATIYDNITDKGTNGKSRQKLAANGGTTDHVTAQIKTEAASALVGYLYIEYIPVPA